MLRRILVVFVMIPIAGLATPSAAEGTAFPTVRAIDAQIAVPAVAAMARQGGDVDLAIEAGVAGFFARGRAIPVTVSLRSRVPLTGVLTVEVGDADPTFTTHRRVELGPGIAESLVIVVPTDPNKSFIDLVASLSAADGATLASDLATVRSDDSVELVAVLPQLAAEAEPPGAVPLAADLGVAHLERVDLALLSEGRRALEIFDVIAATSADLEVLTAGELVSIHRWVLGGGALLLDEPIGDAAAGLPDSWTLGVRGHATFGQGEVMLTSGQLSAGAWSRFLLPQPTSNPVDEGDLGAFFVSFVESPETTMARDARLELPGLALLVGGSLVYTVAIAATWGLLGRARRHLTWVLVPGYALAAVVVILAVGWRARSNERIVHSTIRETSPTGGWATTRVLSVTSQRIAEVALVPGWGAASEVHTGAAPAFEEQDRLGVRLGPGAIGAMVAEGPIDVEELSVEVRSTGPGGVAGTVTNNTPWDLAELAIFGNQQVRPIGALAAGASVEFTMSDLNRFVPFRDREALAWGELIGEASEPTLASSDAAGLRNDGAWRDFVEGRGTNFWSPGSVVAVGWATDVPMPLARASSANGQALGRTALIGRGLITPGTDRLEGTESTRRLVRGPRVVKVDFDGADRFGQVATAVHRFIVPDQVGDRVVDASQLVIEIPKSTVRAEVWTDEGWQPIWESRRDPVVVGLPPGSLIGNSVVVRFDIIFSMDASAEDIEFAIREN